MQDIARTGRGPGRGDVTGGGTGRPVWAAVTVLLALLFGIMATGLVICVGAHIFHFGAIFADWVFGALLFGTIISAFCFLFVLPDQDRWPLWAAPVGMVAAVALFVAFGGTGVDTAWAAPRDRPADVTAVGAWTTADTVVRSRPDQVVGYRITDGRVAWRWVPPGRDAVCAMSESVGNGIGMIGHGATDKPCGTVTALDLTTGKPRWSRPFQAPERSGDTAHSEVVAIAGQTAVVQERTGWRGLNLADGRPGWTVSAGRGCRPESVAGGPGGVVTVEDCPGGPLLRQYDAARGSQVMRASLPITTDSWDVALLSTQPVTIWVQETSQRGTRAVLSFDRNGKVLANIPASGPESDIFLAFDDYSFPARPSRTAVVVDGMLVVVAVQPDDLHRRETRRGSYHAENGRVDGYSLSDGQRRWTRKVAGDELDGLAVEGASVWTLSEDELVQVDARTGERISKVFAYDADDQWADVDLRADRGRFVFISPDGTDHFRPVRVFD